MPQGTGADARPPPHQPPMLDKPDLRTSVATGRYVVDPLAVADALLSRAGIATGSPEPPDAEDRVSRDGARSRPDPERPHPLG